MLDPSTSPAFTRVEQVVDGVEIAFIDSAGRFNRWSLLVLTALGQLGCGLGMVWAVLTLYEPLLSVAMTLLIVGMILAGCLPFAAWAARTRLRGQEAALVAVGAHHWTWTDRSGSQRRQSVHGIDEVWTGRDLFGPIVFVREAGVVSAFRLRERDQATWLVAVLEQWRLERAQEHEETPDFQRLQRVRAVPGSTGTTG